MPITNKRKVVWMGDKPPILRCDGCGQRITGDAFSDIKTNRGPWGCFCDDCLPIYSIGKQVHYGTGLGQRYEKTTLEDGKVEWVKTQG